MRTLHIHNLPDDLYQRIQLMAIAKNCSLSAEVINLLSQAVELVERRMKQAKVLTSIQRRRFKPPENAPSSLGLVREDRAR